MSACICKADAWERDATRDTASSLRFFCRDCGAPGWKRFGERDDEVRPCSDAVREGLAMADGGRWETRRAVRALEDRGYHPEGRMPSGPAPYEPPDEEPASWRERSRRAS